MKNVVRSIAQKTNRLRDCTSGVAAVEFAMVAPVFLLILAGIVDLGQMLHAKSRLDAAVTASASYAIANGEAIKDGSASQLLERVIRLASQTLDPSKGTATVSINDGFQATKSGNALILDGSSSKASLCYCPKAGTNGAVILGSTTQCGAPCAAGGYAGKVVQISVSEPHRALFSGYGFVDADGSITAKTTVMVR